MAKASVEETKVIAVDKEILEPCLKRLKTQGFDQVQSLDSEEGQATAVVWGRYQGEDTPRIFVWAVVPEQWEKVTPEAVQQSSWSLMPSDTKEDEYAQFGMATDGEHQLFFENLTSDAFEVDRLPQLSEIIHYNRLKADPTYKWSLKMYDRLMHGFDAFHEQVYQNVKDRVSSKNDIILEVAKILFLEEFRLNHGGSALEFDYQEQKLQLDRVFTAAYVKQHKEEAIKQIQAAFDHFKQHPDYVVTGADSTAQPIFDHQTHLLLSRPQNYLTLLELIQNLGEVMYNWGEVKKKNGSLSDIATDVLGRVFDVFLRGKFESKGGLGVYLTPAPVKRAMLAIAFHDIMKEDPQILTARDEDGNPQFRFCDPACGSYGFGVVAMGQLERALMGLLGKETAPDVRQDKLFREMCEHSFVGADSAPLMVTLARVNMALLGAPKAKIFFIDSLLDAAVEKPQLVPVQYDLICTNPPFGTPKFSKTQAKAKEAYEREKEPILAAFRSDLKEREKGSGYDYEPTVSGLTMGGKPDGKDIWKPMKATSIDPAVLFIDRCLQLLKPGGRLLIVVPDGVLCNSGDRYVREYIMGKKDETTGEFHGGKAIVKAVISLPADTFKLAGTGAKTSILYLQKRHARKDDPEKFQDDPQTDVFMAVADELGYMVKNNVEVYDPKVKDDLVEIFGAYRRGE